MTVSLDGCRARVVEKNGGVYVVEMLADPGTHYRISSPRPGFQLVVRLGA